jgi:ADP-ribosylglycohydrolase
MRSALLGVCLGGDREKLRAFVRASTRLTHTDPRAEQGAFLVALAAHHGAAGFVPARFLPEARASIAPDPALDALLAQAEAHLARQAEVAEFAAALNLTRGVSGYIYHTVPITLYGWLRWPTDFRRAVEEVIALGGDADTTGAIVGALAGASLGASAIPAEWLRLWEWPRSVGWMRRLAGELAEAFPELGSPRRASPPALFWPGLLPRNLFFLGVVLTHLARRLLPPYRG